MNMTREIKFRVWIKKPGRMVRYVTVSPFFISDGDRLKWSYDEVQVMQYTGLRDKNEKEIYEGDIVDCSRYENDERYLVVIKDIRSFPDALFGSALNFREIIGNVYEHPHLLEAEKK